MLLVVRTFRNDRYVAEWPSEVRKQIERIFLGLKRDQGAMEVNRLSDSKPAGWIGRAYLRNAIYQGNLILGTSCPCVFPDGGETVSSHVSCW